ncbi:acetolactate synthase AlsS [Pediococcus pentosaceus]|jgi:acetolactate synthase-1/2/3 large subunit|uniref:Acetolactate synthase, large subunit n=4 Tax=Pediococcus pentosaceus TaxID=1255 RepID=Q03H21_PEDPA|nr:MULTISPECIES: acetolactate synthase AlsS [Pediococcus]ABJ67501.1 acetolactate synthase, large subunit [Pediococcus pentosaceus ATCC 25745]AHA04640.1 acetolactate synthase [Pediococcus pentosaceus SL4]KAF5438971.1 acetolactate synthase AlsS [Pediococcus sp. EKM202D]KAF5439174.1 acetolactate synthase AlsS [Pediococcus sp. EKM201D]MBF7121877.1 acetolactate synthase AlsS [Pediococcus pentosaceus]
MIQSSYTGSDSILDSLINHDVPYIFGIPGAKIDLLFEQLEHSNRAKKPKLIITRHEQNAAFMAAGVGRITGKPGVVLTTSGPGVGNLATGLLTATAEGDPVLAIGGQVPRNDLLRLTHQSMRNAALFEPITKFSVEVQEPENISEVLANAYRAAESSKQGASFVSFPQDVVNAPVSSRPIKPLKKPILGPASPIEIEELAKAIRNAQLPVLLLGMRASSPEVTKAVRELVRIANLPVVETFQGAGIISHDLEDHFYGRVGLFRNQPGDKLLKHSDLVITVGYDAIEYEPRNWNAEGDGKIIVIDDSPSEIDHNFEPEKELVGDIAQTIDLLTPHLKDYQVGVDGEQYLETLRELQNKQDLPPVPKQDSKRIHPLSIISALQYRVDDEMTVSVDVGSFYIWMARHFRSYQPRHLLFSNGMQTLGVALPWAISAALLRPNSKSVSVSGDGGFLFSAQELETAVREKLDIVHIIWNDGYYDMVKFQEEIKYGHSAGVDFGPVDFVKLAEGYGAKGLRVEKPEDLGKILDEAFQTEGPVVVDIPVDYSDNVKLGQSLLPDQL